MKNQLTFRVIMDTVKTDHSIFHSLYSGDFRLYSGKSCT